MREPRGTSWRRRNYFVDKKLQSRFAAVFAGTVLLGLAANLLAAYFLIDRELGQGLYKIHIKIRTTSEIAVPVLLKLGAVTVSAVLAVSAVIGYFVLRRIELPLLELREAVKGVSRGDLTRRVSNDMPGGLADAFNAMTVSLASLFGSLKKSGQALERESRGLEGPARDAKELAAALKGIARERKSISHEISKMKV
ncbi:MAG: methyl-accepting chemotaxis protein [Candidatus Methylomirabilis sp.]|nr:methyl-accepting chemotaxis protein [Deltaproteobacteria bacterium]